MKHFFLDTNVIIDFLADRKPFADDAGRLFTLALEKKARVYCSVISFNNIYYLFRQTHSHGLTIKLLEQLKEMTEVAPLTEKIINQALQADFRDFEDAIQYFSALVMNNLDGIVTRNAKDFSKSRLPVLNPREALVLLQT